MKISHTPTTFQASKFECQRLNTHSSIGEGSDSSGEGSSNTVTAFGEHSEGGDSN